MQLQIDGQWQETSLLPTPTSLVCEVVVQTVVDPRQLTLSFE